MKTIANLISDHADRFGKQMEEARQSSVAFTGLSEVWPTDRPLERLYYSRMSGRRLGELHCEAVVETREDALEYLRIFTLEPLAYMKDTFTTIRAIAWNEDKIENCNTVITDIYPLYWTFGDYAKASLKCFISFGDLRVSLQVKINSDPARRSIMRDDDRRIVRWSLSNAPNGEVIKYSSGGYEHAGDVIVYFPEEPGNGPGLKEYLEKSWTIEWRLR